MIIVIPITNDTAAQAERLLDLIYWQRGQQQSGHCLLAFTGDVHPELQEKLSITANLAFATERCFAANFHGIAAEVAKRYKDPWLYLTPDCVPLVPQWIQLLEESYDVQPKRYFGPFLMTSKGEKLLSRVAIYPIDADKETASSLIPFSTQTKLIQELKFAGNEGKLRSDAVLLHGDPTGILVEKMIAQYCAQPDLIPPGTEPAETPAKRRGRPPKVAAKPI